MTSHSPNRHRIAAALAPAAAAWAIAAWTAPAAAQSLTMGYAASVTTIDPH